MLKRMKEISKKTKVILLAVCLIAIVGIGSVITACTIQHIKNQIDLHLVD